MQFARPNGIADRGHERAALATVRQQFSGLVGIACGLELDDLDIDAMLLEEAAIDADDGD